MEYDIISFLKKCKLKESRPEENESNKKHIDEYKRFFRDGQTRIYKYKGKGGNLWK